MERNLLTASYIENFACIGGACEDNCCEGKWNISVDKNSFFRYKKIKDQKLNKYIVRNKKAQGNMDYAYIKHRGENGSRCPFLSEEKYCGLQIDYGEAFLCDTCKTYPRSYIEINNMLELWLSTSCPEVARQVLFLEGGIKLENMTFEMDESILTSSYKIKDEIDYNIYQYFWDIRLLSLSILQDRNYSMSERMIILGLFYNKLH